VPTIRDAAIRLAALFSGGRDELSDRTGSDIEFESTVIIRPLSRTAPPADCWAVDGGQALVADARSVQVAITRAARVRWQGDLCTLEEQGTPAAHVLVGPGGGPEAKRSLAEMEAPVAPAAHVDLNLLRDWSEWQLVARCVEDAEPGAMVLVDGDLQPDWRISAHWLAELLRRAAQRNIALVGVTKHSSLARGGAPLIGQLEIEAESALGARACWWATVGVRRTDLGPVRLPHPSPEMEPDQRPGPAPGTPPGALPGPAPTLLTDPSAEPYVPEGRSPGLTVVVARLDPDARFAFRADLPGHMDAEALLGQLSALADDAGFPGYPYPLSVADRLASCPGWLREEAWGELDGELAAAGVPEDVRERAFADRHGLMERS
jgi:hypothetical protein